MSLADFDDLVDRAGAELEQLHLKPYLALYVFEAVVSRSATLTQGKVHLLRKKARTKDLTRANWGGRRVKARSGRHA